MDSTTVGFQVLDRYGLPTLMALGFLIATYYGLRELWKFFKAQLEAATAQLLEQAKAAKEEAAKERLAAAQERALSSQRMMDERDKFLSALENVTSAYRQGLEALTKERQKRKGSQNEVQVSS